MHVLEIPKVVVSRLCLGNLVVRLWLASMDNIWELHGVLNEEHWDIISHNVPVALFRIKFDGKASNIANSICGATTT